MPRNLRLLFGNELYLTQRYRDIKTVMSDDQQRADDMPMLLPADYWSA